MENLGTYAYVPLAALLIGALLGLAVGRYFGLIKLLILLGAFGALSLLLIVRVAGVGPGEEGDAFLPYALLVGVLFPALFGAVMGGLGGRAWAVRKGR